MRVGDKVRIKDDIYEFPDGDTPGGYCAMKDDIVIIREIYNEALQFPYSVSHEDRTDGNTFGVKAEEIEEME